MNTPSIPVVDALDRPLRDLRISVTDRCNLRCSYCMPADRYREDHAFLPKSALLTFDEIVRSARAAVSLGAAKLRLTGGEPLLRRDLPGLVEQLAALAGVEDLALTTNGILLPQWAQSLREAGLHRVTVSLDSLDEDVLRTMNGTTASVDAVLRGIDAVVRAGFPAPKINVVVQQGVNDHTLMDLVRHFRGTGCVLRFIEFMDVGTLNRWAPGMVVPSRRILDTIHTAHPLRPLSPTYRGEVAERYAYADGQGEVGFISSVTQPFCGDCSRLRLSSDGMLFTCLFGLVGVDLKAALRAGAGDEEVAARIRQTWEARKDRYSEVRASAPQGEPVPKVEMYHVGG